MNLAYVPEFLESSNTAVHNRYLTGSIMDLFNGNRPGIASVDDTLIIFDRYKLSCQTKYRPIFLDESINFVSLPRLEVS